MINKEKEFQEFCKKTEKALSDYYGEEYQINIQKVRKTNNIILTGITITQKEKNIAPTIYLEPYFEIYSSGMTFGEIIKRVIKVYEDNKWNHDIDVDFFNDYESVKKKVCYKLINYELNEELLKEVPYIRYLDLAIVFYCIIVNDYIGNGSILIHNNHMKLWKVDTDILLQDAHNNMPRIYPPELKSMTDVMKEMFRQEKEDNCEYECQSKQDISFSSSVVCTQIEQMEESSLQMYVLTNKSRLHGAAVILYENILSDMAMFFENDLYILPSSVHEVIIVPKYEDVDEAYLSQMVNEVNETQLRTEEVLANHAYLYLQEEKQIIALPLIPE